MKLTLCSSAAEATAELTRLSSLVEQHAVAVPPSQLAKLRRQLQVEEEVWSDTVKQGLEVLEAQCQAVVGSLSQQLRKARAAEHRAATLVEGMEAETVRVQAELKEAEERVTALKEDLTEAEEAPEAMRRVQSLYKAEAERVEKMLEPCGGACEEEQDEEGVEDEAGSSSKGSQRKGSSKRKRGSAQDGCSSRAKRSRLDGASLYDEAMKWTVVDNARVRVLIELAAECEFACAQAYCLSMGWGGVEKDHKKAFAMLRLIPDRATRGAIPWHPGLFHDKEWLTTATA